MRNSALTVHLSAVTQALIDACGGFIAAALECDVSKSQLQRAADPNHSYTLKASTIWHLEQACGQPIVSRALFNMNAVKSVSESCPLYLGIDFADSATDLTVAILASLKDGKISIFEHRELTGRTTDIQSQLSELGQSFQPHLAATSPQNPELKALS